MRQCYKNFQFKSMPRTTVQLFRQEECHRRMVGLQDMNNMAPITTTPSKD